MGIINKLAPLLIVLDDENGYFIQQPNGELVLPSEVQKIINGLQDFCLAYSDEEILTYNEKYTKTKKLSFNKHKQKQNLAGYVYVLKCENNFKIGYSKDVNKRIKQLDTRPFKLELLLQVYSSKAYTLEQELHKRLQAYVHDGEWYYISWNIDDIKLFIDETARYLKCEIQY